MSMTCRNTALLSYLFEISGASEPKNMAYMSRLGIWGKGTPFKEFGQFIQAVEKRWIEYLTKLKFYFGIFIYDDF